MKIEIRPFTHDLIDHYIAFFDGEGQADKPEWQGCRCVHFHWNDTFEAAFHAGKNRRAISKEMLESGIVKGYLAFSDAKIVGWCNVNDKTAYDRLKSMPELWIDSRPRTKAAVCFLVRPDMRGNGIAKQLLAHALDEAKAEGYAFFEGYPPLDCQDQFDAHRGTVPFFEQFGFALTKHGDVAVMQKEL